MISSQQSNKETADDLICATEALKGIHGVLIAQCDDIQSQDERIVQYEEVQPFDVSTYRIEFLDSPNPNLYLALSNLIAVSEHLQRHGNAIITVTGVEKLSKAARKVFLGNLEYKMTQLQRLPFTIILWVTREMAIDIANKAPTFYECAKGVFRF